MAKKKSSRAKGKVKSSFMFPHLHKDIENAVDSTISPWFCEEDSDEDVEREYTTHVMGDFKCVNDSCSSKGWGSKKVAILIRGYSDDGYNAEVFNQCCKACNRLGLFFLNEKSYIERVAYRIQKWAGIDDVERPHYSSKKGKPHQRQLCEGCRRGYCDQSGDEDYD